MVESESVAGGITLELELQWDGNPNIVLDIKTRVGLALPVQVKCSSTDCLSSCNFV